MLVIIIVLLIPGLGLALLVRQRRWPRARRLASGLLISYGSIMLVLTAGELYFRFVHAAPEGLRARENWMARYWQTNSLGFRDREWTPADWAGKKTVVVLGDSFTAGWGLPNPADRFGDVLARKLGDSYAVINLGVPGAATRQELKRLQDYPLKQPDVVILQYFLNDIEDAALSVGQYQQFPQAPAWVKESYLANFFFALQTSGFGPDYWRWEFAAYDNYAIWDIHRQELEDFSAYTDRIGARLLVVIFPNLQAPFHSIPYVDRVAQVFEAKGKGGQVLKLFDAAEAMPIAERIVSPRDAHPSAQFHRLVGELLYERFFAAPQ
jgi:hypothetical protein